MIRLAIGALASAHVLADEKREPTPAHLFVEESGVFNGMDSFCIGAIVAKEPDKHLKYIWHLRLRDHYRSRLLSRSSDKFKQAFAHGVIQYFFRTADLKFGARVVNKRESDQELPRSAREAAYHRHYKKLILDSVPKDLPVWLTLVNHSRGGADNLLRAYLREEIPHLAGIQVAKLRENDLLQLANLLAGSVSGGETVEDKVRLSPVLQLKQTLRVDTLQSPSLWRNPKFRVRAV